MKNLSKKRAKRRGAAIVEVSLMMPWIVFLFVGVLDMGFYTYAAISVQNAARAAAIRVAVNQFSFSTANACTSALGELRGLPNMYAVTTCAASAGAISDAVPAAVVVTPLNNTTSPQCADCAVSPAASSVQATVTYRTMPMIPIPGLVMGRLTLTRIAETRVLGE